LLLADAQLGRRAREVRRRRAQRPAQDNHIDAKAALPMFALMVVMVGILYVFPELATWLPENMRTRPGGDKPLGGG
jgi:hypothetical protein